MNGPTPSESFAAVAEWIALDPDNESFIFRKFDSLAARNLLYQQARIINLEKQLEELDHDVAKTHNMTLKDAARTWEQLIEQSAAGQYHAQQHMGLIIELKQALKDYRIMCPAFPTQRKHACFD